MNDPKRQTSKLTDEERLRRLKEGGESQRAQAAMEEAQRGIRSGERESGFSGLTPQEEERRRMMGEKMEESTRGLGETQQAEMSMWGREGRREGMGAEQAGRREAEPTQRVSAAAAGYGAGRGAERAGERPTERPMTSQERIAGGDLGPAGGGTYYYEGREGQSQGVAAPGGSFGRTEYTPSGRPPVTQEPTPQERMRETGGGAMAKTREAGGEAMGRTQQAGTQAVEKTKEVGGQAMEKTKEVGGQAWEKTKQAGQKLTERTREATGGASAEEVASQAGESIGRGIRKVVSVGSGILSGLRRGMGEGRRAEEEGRESRREEYPSEEREITREQRRETGELRERPAEYRETEYREVRRREQP